MVFASALAWCFVLQVAVAAPAYGVKYDIQGKNYQYKYGSSAYILVNKNPSVAYTKVTGLVTFRTDWTALAEIGHYWDGGSPKAFYVWTDTFGLNQPPSLGYVSEGSTQRYHTGYHYADGLQYFWWGNTIVATEWIYPSMTSQWPGVNVERTTPDYLWGDNLGCFTGLRYKNYNWGSWSYWNAVRLESDTDNRYRMEVSSPTHVDFELGY